MRQEKVWFVISGILTVLAVALMLPTGAAAAFKYKVLHKCDRGSAILPEAGLIFDKAGNLYGTTAAGCGDVFKLRRTRTEAGRSSCCMNSPAATEQSPLLPSSSTRPGCWISGKPTMNILRL
jgi:hypothetical protein